MAKHAKSEHLKDDLMTKLREGLLVPGDCLPSENQYCVSYGITRPTVRQVLSELCAKGLLEKRPGIGTFVKDPDEPPDDFFKKLHIGTNFFFATCEYYSLPMANAVRESKYSRGCFFSPVSMCSSDKSQLDGVDALMFSVYNRKLKALCSDFTKPIVAMNLTPEFENVGNVWVDHYAEAKKGVDYLILDTAWMLDSGYEPLEIAKKFRARLYGAHIKDFVFTRSGRPEDVTVGTGNLDLPSFMKFLSETDYDNTLSLEFEGDPADPAPALTKCVDAVRALM